MLTRERERWPLRAVFAAHSLSLFYFPSSVVVVLLFRVLLTLNAGTRARALRNAKTRLCMDGTNVQDGLHALLIVLTMCELLLVARIKTDTFLYAGKFHSAIYLRYTSGEKKYIYKRTASLSQNKSQRRRRRTSRFRNIDSTLLLSAGLIYCRGVEALQVLLWHLEILCKFDKKGNRA